MDYKIFEVVYHEGDPDELTTEHIEANTPWQARSLVTKRRKKAGTVISVREVAEEV